MKPTQSRTLLPKYAVGFAFVCLAPFASLAISITVPNPIGSFQRQATLNSATDADYGVDNPKEADIAAEFPGLGTWTLRSDKSGSNGTDGFLTVAVTSGSWGSGDAAGTWAIGSSFWSLYGSAVIALHVGNGGGDPDHFSFLVENGKTTGTWSYDLVTGTGGGLSNLRLFSSGTPGVPPSATSVPDGGASFTLLGLALVGLGIVRAKLRE